MPDKSPGFWMSLLAWFRAEPDVSVAAATGLMALLRSCQQGKSLRAMLLDSCICAFLAFYLRDALGLCGVDQDWAMILGVVLGYLGTEFIRTLLIRWAERRAGITRH
ncbi:phage holin, lambda family [Escherichia marmotae]|uniref:phage holin, lambda family n=1 Tax=Escherichia TaxID=561 RepID=UPI00022428B2|nr:MULTISPECIES: phage holin, lambda family [Escherichia]EFZ2274207.1 phage holin, lambda family [Shigella sonnei]EEQ2458692.1 phage holin, lambda family [Escherichia coli]EEQ6524470.1 phage holin, lambda family [Escherichia coli]EEQ9687117.1 phage holin, lambda family [Escherichia coli]EEQ9773715.1 phage holin, lambda family [Escherichia coli]